MVPVEIQLGLVYCYATWQ